MANVLFLTLLLFTFFAHAECFYHNGKNSVSIKDGESLSLRSPGKPLEKFEIHDQDGLNTCYANSASTVLKTMLPGHPDISYTHTAVMATTRGHRQNWSGSGQNYIKKEIDPKTKKERELVFADYGYFCEALVGLKNAGGACPKSLSVPESIELWSVDLQQSLFSNLGHYFDKMNEIKNDPTKLESLKKELNLAIEAIRLEESHLVRECEERKSPDLPVYDAVKMLIDDQVTDHLVEQNNCTKAKVEAIQKLLTDDSIIAEDRYLVTPRAEILNKFSLALHQDPQLERDLRAYILDEKQSLSHFAQLPTGLGIVLNNLLEELVPQAEYASQCPGTIPGKSALIKGDPSDFAKNFIYSMKANKGTKCKNILQSYELEKLLGSNKNANSCIEHPNLEMIISGLKPFLDIQAEIASSLIPQLLNPESRFADQMIKVLMPGCLNLSNLIDVSNLSCSSYPFCDPKNDFNDNNSYQGPHNGCMEKTNAKALMRTKSIQAIKEGHAIGVSVCTAFLKEDKKRTHYCKTPLAKNEKYNFHQMTISGYRCEAGKMEYEIINSWGSQCEDNSDIKCQKDEYGNPTGPFWVQEEALLDNSTGINVIKEVSSK